MDHPNWVEQHAKCDIKNLFREIYVICKKDAKRRNDIDTPIWKKYQFHLDGGGIEYIKVSRTPRAERTDEASYDDISFQSEGDIITLQAGSPRKDYIIKTHWDQKNYQCVIQLHNGEDPEEWPHEHLWKMIQSILDPLFFPTQ